MGGSLEPDAFGVVAMILLITIQVMGLAARHGGLWPFTGGTVIHAKGTGSEKAEKFLGLSIKAGPIVFSLPVTETAGMRLIEEE